MNNKILSLIGICQKAGKLKSGDFSCLNAIRDNSAKLTLICAGASQNTKKRFTDKSTFYNIPIAVIDCTTAELGKQIGKGQRAVVTVTDTELAKKILGLLSM